MRKWMVPLLLWGMAWPASAAKTLSIDQMEQLLITLHGKPDGKGAGELDDVQLTDRVSPTRLSRWEADFPGSRTHEELIKLADMSAFLNPPASEVVSDPQPDLETQRHMLWIAEQYVGTTMSQLPDFFATRETAHFEAISQPNPDSVGGGTPALQWAGVYSRTVTYRDGREVAFEGADKQEKEPVLGFTTHGEFGPILSQVLYDALEGHVSFLRWERGASEPVAVFIYIVPENASHFQVNTRIENQAQTIRPAYRGEIEIDPVTGEILRLTEIADITPPQELEGAAIEVEYGPVTIGAAITSVR